MTTKPNKGEASKARIAYSLELAQAVCRRMLDRNSFGMPRSIREISTDPDMPKERTIYDWLRAHEDFARLYAHAREDQAHMCAAQIVEIVDVEEDPVRARVRMDARKWYASKLNAKHYGDKITQEVSGPEGGPMSVTWLPLEK